MFRLFVPEIGESFQYYLSGSHPPLASYMTCMSNAAALALLLYFQNTNVYLYMYTSVITVHKEWSVVKYILFCKIFYIGPKGNLFVNIWVVHIFFFNVFGKNDWKNNWMCCLWKNFREDGLNSFRHPTHMIYIYIIYTYYTAHCIHQYFQPSCSRGP